MPCEQLNLWLLAIPFLNVAAAVVTDPGGNFNRGNSLAAPPRNFDHSHFLFTPLSSSSLLISSFSSLFASSVSLLAAGTLWQHHLTTTTLSISKIFDLIWHGTFFIDIPPFIVKLKWRWYLLSLKCGGRDPLRQTYTVLHRRFLG